MTKMVMLETISITLNGWTSNIGKFQLGVGRGTETEIWFENFGSGW